MEKIILAGGSGFLGSLLIREFLAGNFEVINLSRNPQPQNSLVTQVKWDGETLGEWAEALNGAHTVINLTGKNIDCRFNAKNRRDILESRINSVNAVGKAIQLCPQPPKSWIQAGAIAYYGNRGDQVCDEGSSPGEGFLSEVCQQWEQTTLNQATPGTRKIIVRLGVVLDRNGGALKKLTRITRLGLGGTAGNGRQWIPWIHSHDFVRIFQWVMENQQADGIYNGVSPNPVQNKFFMKTLRETLNVKIGLPAPGFASKLGAFFLRTEPSLILDGSRCIPQKLLNEGFVFNFGTLHQGLDNLVN